MILAPSLKSSQFDSYTCANFVVIKLNGECIWNIVKFGLVSIQ